MRIPGRSRGSKPIMNEDQCVSFIRRLQEIPGAIHYDGDASVQVVFQLANGKVLRIGFTDEDVADQPGLIWADTYEGLFKELISHRG